tara:strand:+ start:20 stop:535 length:516 start_codon:yes stop_codon:yes gene_type:complete
MAKALFITTEDIKRYSVISGSVDPDKLIFYVEIAQDTEIQNYLGTVLLEKLQALIIAGTVNDPANAAYKTLLETYVKPMTIYWSLVQLMSFIPYTIANGGVYKHTSESSETVSKDEVDYLAEKYRDIAQFYTNNFVSFMIYNQTKYPEYNANTEDDIYPDTSNADFGGWVL